MEKVLENRKRKMKGQELCSLQSVVKDEPVELDILPDQSDSSLPQTGVMGNSMTSLSDAGSSDSSSEVNGVRSPPVLGTDILPVTDSARKDPSSFRMLTPAEYILFEDLAEAYGSTLGELIQDRNFAEESYNNGNDLINNSTVAVSRLIKFIKRLEDFQKLSQEDQISALKGCVLSSIILRSSCFYNIERCSWMTGSGEISTSILKSTGYSELHEVHTKFCKTLKQLIRDDMTLFSLIQVICIFNPECKELHEKCVMSNIQDKYIILLKHYLEWEFSYINARDIFANLLNIIADMKRVSDAHNSIILQANPADIEPLMLEVLDLK